MHKELFYRGVVVLFCFLGLQHMVFAFAYEWIGMEKEGKMSSI